MDKSVLNRYVPVEMDYDKRVEEQILSLDTDFLEFLWSVRTASNENQAEHIISTRDMGYAKTMIESGRFTRDNLIKFFAIKDKSASEFEYFRDTITSECKANNPYVKTLGKMISNKTISDRK